ncbi:Receptor-like protein 55, partial [Linum grandiflorum]
TITNANLSCIIPDHLVDKFTHIDFSRNNLKGRIPSSIAMLENLQSLILSFNSLFEELPANLGHLISLKNVSQASNLLSCFIPDAFFRLVHL